MRRRWTFALLGVWLSGSVAAQDVLPPLTSGAVADAPVDRQVLPNRHGYAFARPDILLRQRLLGLAHGLRLLGRECLLESEYSLSVEQAYGQWYQTQSVAIDTMGRDLERWYYGSVLLDAHPEVRQRDIARLLGLRNELRKLGTEEHRAACATYPQAIAADRYDLAKLLRMDEAFVLPARAPVPEPATQPTVQPTAEPVAEPTAVPEIPDTVSPPLSDDHD